MSRTRKMITKAANRWLFAAAVALSTFVAMPDQASAQEILLTGPLAGAPPVRKLRLYREGRLELSPMVSAGLLDEYVRTVYAGARFSYYFTDWIGVGLMGSYGALNLNTGLTDRVQKVNKDRRDTLPADDTERRLTSNSVGPDFGDQVGTMDWMGAAELRVVPFRGKLALFNSAFVDTDLYLFAGPAFVGLNERKACDLGECSSADAYKKEGRTAISGTFGLGLTFFVNSYNAFFLEWRMLPVERSIAGFDIAGTGAESAFPDNKFDESDRELRFNQYVTFGWNFYLPTDYRMSE